MKAAVTEDFIFLKITVNFKRRFFTKSRIFLEKRSKLSEQAFAKKCCAAILVLKVSQNLGREITEFYWIFGCVTRQNIVKYKER
jgi:hypothetical protein